MMLEKVKLAKRIQTTVFDQELLDLIGAGIKDLQHPGAKFDYTVITDSETGEVTDYQITDLLVARAVTTYAIMNFGNPENYDKLKASYDEQKGQLRESLDYGMEIL